MNSIAICDDELPVCTEIERTLEPYQRKYKWNIEVFYSGEKLYEALCAGELYDLIFLDIELGRINGVEIGRKIRNELNDERVQIVYISARQEYAMELFTVRPLNFLVKPIVAQEIIANVEKAMKLSALYDECFEFQSGQNLYRISYGDILYFESHERKVDVYMKRRRESLYRKLSEVEESAPVNFIRIHQSYLVNRRYVKRWKYEEVIMINGKILPISQSYRSEVRRQLRGGEG